MEVKEKLLAILKRVDLDPEVRARLIALVEEGPITKSLIDDITNVLELSAKEQDHIVKIEGQKADLYGEMAAQLEALEDEEMADDEKNLTQLATDLEAIGEEAKTHLAEAPVTPSAELTQSAAPEITAPAETGMPTVPPAPTA